MFFASLIIAVATITPGAPPETVGEDALRTLGWGYAVTLLSVWMLMILCVSFYRISRDDHEKNLQALAEKRAEQA